VGAVLRQGLPPARSGAEAGPVLATANALERRLRPVIWRTARAVRRGSPPGPPSRRWRWQAGWL